VQLQVVCYQLWQGLTARDERSGTEDEVRSITAEDLARAGDVDRALTQFYEETLAAALADPAAAGASERQLRDWFDKELITEAGTRGLVQVREQKTGSLPTGVVRALERRFLVRAEARGSDTWIELVHDRFVEPIRQSNRAWFSRNLNPLTLDAQAWLDAGKPASKLYGGSQLAAAAAQIAANPADFGEAERSFVEAAQQVEMRRAARRQRAIAWGAAGLALGFIVLAGWALFSRADARKSEVKAVAEATRALNAEATANAEKGIAQQNADLAASREAEARVAEAGARKAEATAVAAEAQAVAAKAKVEHLTLGIRADQLTANALKVVDESPPLALLLAAEGLRVQNDITVTVPITRVHYDFDSARYVTEMTTITTGEAVVA
jgi:hypothetical protein